VNNDVLDLTKLGTQSEEIPQPGTPENPWIGVDRMVNGQKQFHALSGKELRRARRASERAAAAETAKGQRRYNRQQRKQAFDAGTVRQQLRILSGELQVSFDMQNNLTAHIMRQAKLNEREQLAPERKAAAAERRDARLARRRGARIAAGKPRHADLVFAGKRES
jgi:hypothetical protein